MLSFLKRKDDRLDTLLWHLFPNAIIESNHMIDGILIERFVPEYRMAIMTEGWMHKYALKHADIEDVLFSKNIRYAVVDIDNDINSARNAVIQTINTIYVKNTTEPAILTPRLAGDAGWDIVTSDTVVVQPESGFDVPSDLFIEMPNHLYGVVQARSSTSKRRLTVLPGVIDPAYRGRVYAMVYNLTRAPIQINKGDRIAQMLFMPRIPHLTMAHLDTLSPTERGESGFGSTGSSLRNES